MDRKTVTCPESWKNMREELVSVGSHSSLSLPVFSYISPNVRRKFTTCTPRLSRVSGIRVRCSAKEREDAEGGRGRSESFAVLRTNITRVVLSPDLKSELPKRGGREVNQIQKNSLICKALGCLNTKLRAKN